MNFQRKKVATALGLIGAGGAFLLAGAPAQAQDIRVDVTGSNIKRVEGEGALPVQTLTRSDLDNVGVQNASELLDKISANASFNSFNEAGGAGSSFAGFTGASLRGLGYGRTLVLLNGRRVSAYAFSDGSGVDLSSLPLAALERVEVLKDGASAIYGTDAIAGVINFITKKDFRGIEAYGYYGGTDEGGGDSWRATVTGGWGDLTKDKFNVFVNFDYQKQDALAALDREISKTAYIPAEGVNRTSGYSYPANINIVGVTGTRNPTNPTCAPPFSYPTTGSSARQCRYDFASQIETIPETEKTNIVGRATWRINADHEAFLEGGYFNGKYTYRISPTPVIGFDGNPFLPTTSPYFPAAFISSVGGDPTKPVEFLWRMKEFGPRTSEATNDFYRAVAGLQGTIFKNWDYAAAFNWTENEQSESNPSGYFRESALFPLLASGVVNPFGDNTEAVRNQVLATQVSGDIRKATAKNYGFDGKVSTEIFKLPAGSVAMALGGDWHKEELDIINTELYQSGDIIGGSGAIPSMEGANRDVWAIYAEFNIPIVKTLEANVAVRYDDYSDFGGTTNPKISLRWQPSKQLLVRGSWGTGFRAPTLNDLYQPTLTTNTSGSFDDPARCPTTQSALDCERQFDARRGGNLGLQPETSTQWYAGIVWEPFDSLSLGVDFFQIKLEDAFTFVNADTIWDSDALFASQVVRKPNVDPQYPNLPPPIAYVNEYTINAAKQEVQGWDFSGQWRSPATAGGRFGVNFTGTYLDKWKQSDALNTEYPNYVGTRGSSGAIPRWRHNITLDWTLGPWGATLGQTFQLGYTEPSTVTASGDRRVGDYSIWDLQGRYNGFKNLALTAGIKNLLNDAPPFSTQNDTFQVGFDPTYGDPRGRIFYGSVKYSFK
jgi:iron complex outermembrane recepter protein